MSNRLTNFIAGLLLLTMFLLAVFSIKNDSFTFDETAHVAAGYSYLTKKDYRSNPEHPPIIKDLVAIPLLFLGLNFPIEAFEKVNPALWWAQFDFGNEFLYKSGNNPDQILFWSRFPIILLLVFFGWFLFYWTKREFGNKVALLTITFFSFSPTLLAHGRLVTTDVGAAFGVALATYFWLNFLKKPGNLNILFAGLFFGLAVSIKFNLVLLVPFFGIITILWAWLKKENILRYIKLGLLAGIIGLIFIVFPIYQIHVLNYPKELQVQHTQEILSTAGNIPEFLKNFNLFLAKSDIFRPFGEFLLGLNMATNRTASGNTTFFLGKISAEGRKSYFPIVYLIKEPLALHLLTIFVLFFWAYKLKEPFWKSTGRRLKKWISENFTIFSMIIFLIIYWATSISGNLNIGVRHILPTIPFIYVLVSSGIVYCFENIEKRINKKIVFLIFLILVSWYCYSSVSVFPHYLAYFNELAGGPENGYKFVVDSNLDWGQDLKRLKIWVEENNIDKIYLDYFGGGNPEYYLKEKYVPWWGQRNPAELPEGSYLAISANQLQGGRAVPVNGYDLPSDYYMWIYQYEPPIAKIGYSIFIYKI